MRECSEYIGISRSQLYQKRNELQIPGQVRIGRRILWDRETLDRYILEKQNLGSSEK